MTQRFMIRRGCIAVELSAWYLRRFPFDIAKWRLWKWTKPAIRQLGALLPPRVLWTKDQFRLLIDPNDHLGREIFLWGEYEPGCSHVMRRLLNPGDNVLDIGANIGYFTFLAASYVGETGKVIAFEASPITFQQLKRNTDLNQFKQVEIRCQAVSKAPGRLTFYQGPFDHSGVSALRPISNSSASFEVQTLKLDQERESLPTIAYVKIDVEGAEFDVLTGMQEILHRDSPEVMLELTDEYLKDFGSSAEALVTLMGEQGYTCYMISDQGLTPLTHWDPTLTDQQVNVLFSVHDVSSIRW
ncbi:FkbM family methyltransferase [candidate division KSB3 bacterium]|uniref:FkbM family methyltransferase n=1 Tax=candidate division KSB3 bacterium TaxID=2044937 RepID=A0A9D5K064_9BACT|nr:FkbM family methyltransferase [candidate division KSB3 bacterium]MBD3327215.1 FkbM family methyltransferase [candidate division KSB3 bacterium]